MADDSNGSANKNASDAIPAGAQQIPVDPNAPRMNVVAQYVKDLSFENPEAPAALTAPRSQPPRITIGINVTANRLSSNDVEVALKIEANAKDDERSLFAAELVYAGLFRMSNVPENQMTALSMVECPRLLFPFARQVLAEATRNGGFPPLMIDPVDFLALFRERQRREQGMPATPPPANLS
ncbi:MAG: protein-export chaperone SecB [Bauldia sp.]|nr:protein-export chaperone SecB [Bauldia sp.]